jgi:DNA end-binding protein Ku
MWSGQLGFGLVQFPVKLYTATSSHDVGFNQFHGASVGRSKKPCLGQIKYVKTCATCANVVPQDDIARGVPINGGVVVVSDEEIESLEHEGDSKLIQVLMFVDQAEIDPVQFEKSYFVGAAGPPTAKVIPPSKPYALLAEAMVGKGLVAIVKWTLRNKSRRAVLRVVDGVIYLHTLYWPDEVREPEVPGLGGDFTAAEMHAATTLVEAMVGKWDPDDEQLVDVAQMRLKELIDAKAAGEPFQIEPTIDLDETEVGDLLAKLKASARAASKTRHPAGKKIPAKKTPATKAPVRKAAPKRRSA